MIVEMIEETIEEIIVEINNRRVANNTIKAAA